MADKDAQDEELVVLQSVFPEGEFEDHGDSYLIESPNPNISLNFKFSYPSNYPSKDHPVFTISCGWLLNDQIKKLSDQLLKLFVPGEVVVFTWTEWLRENTISFLGLQNQFTATFKSDSPKDVEPEESDTLVPVVEEDIDQDQDDYIPDPTLPPIYHGTPVTDRKSKFQAHMAAVHSVEEAERIVAELLKDKKIANATHNISAYKIVDSNGVKHEHRDDDGETGAGCLTGQRFLLEKSTYVNIIVVVTRWYGGIMLGADRFKHINGVAKQLLEEKYKELTEAAPAAAHGKFRPSEDVYNRIKWDSSLDVNDFIIGYEDRFVGDMEIPFSEFGDTEIPFHRIRYFKKNEELVWDRRKKYDKFFV